MNLSASETRVLGCLLEKQRTTPDQYPLSLNALRLACNQSTNRDPVVEYDEAILRDALHRLERRGYTRYASGAGSRTPKYRHLLAEALPMAEDEQAVMCVLMLRGPQTPGELKQRTERMHLFADLGLVHETLERLIGRELVACLGRRPGQKEDRYVQLLQDDAEENAGVGRPDAWAQSATGADSTGAGTASFARPTAAAETGASDAALAELTQRVARLEREVAELRATLGEPGAASAEEATAAEAARDPTHAGSWPEPNGSSQR
ncbi:MAG TPA: YceH family protein [Solirubrobacteraceae bacterium]|nr:YceH family protein [Solirubrobacteraceae bacterium]